MNLAEIKTSPIAKRELFQIERAVVREMTDLWYKQGRYFDGNFAEHAEVTTTGTRITVSFKNGKALKHGSPEATVNELMKSLILTMATEPRSGALLDNHEDIIGNILDVFVYRLKEIGDRKFLLHRLQTLDLGFRVGFGLGEPYAPIRNARRFLEEVLTSVSATSPQETVKTLLESMWETEKLGLREQGVTFHIIMEEENEASFMSLPLEIQQADFVSLISEHTLRCNIIGSTTGEGYQLPGIFKIDAPTHPLQFIRHKGFHFDLDEKLLMEKLSSSKSFSKKDFILSELSFLKLLFNEYVQLASFLLKSGMIDPQLRLLIIFPRVNFFKIIHEELPQVSPDEPQSIGELAAYQPHLFRLQDIAPPLQIKKSYRIPERVLQERRIAAIKAVSQSTAEHIQTPLLKIRGDLNLLLKKELSDHKALARIHARLHGISDYLKKLHNLQRVVVEDETQTLDLEASLTEEASQQKREALEEIAKKIQIAEIEPMKEVITTKMLDYLSFATVKLEQMEKFASMAIKKEIVEDILSQTELIISQSRAFYKLLETTLGK